jgi:hypothetical protein
MAVSTSPSNIDGNGDEHKADCSTSNSGDTPKVGSQAGGLAWAKLQPEDRTAVLGVLIDNCQQAIHRFLKEKDLLEVEDHGKPIFPLYDRFFPATASSWSLVHWTRKMQQMVEICPRFGMSQTACDDLVDNAEKLTEAVERHIVLDRTQMFEYIKCAQVICSQVKGWQWIHQMDVIQSAVEKDQVNLLELNKMRSVEWWSKVLCAEGQQNRILKRPRADS